MKKNDIIRLVFYVITLGLIVWYPLKKIIAYEFPAVPPVEYDFKLSLYDPYDPLRGRYVQLEKRMTCFVPGPWKMFSYRDELYALLAKDEDGFAVVKDLLLTPPEEGDYIKVKFLWESGEKVDDAQVKKGTYCDIELPFDRFYLNEKDAPEMERRVREASAEGRAVVKVKVYKDGTAVISDLMVGE